MDWDRILTLLGVKDRLTLEEREHLLRQRRRFLQQIGVATVMATVPPIVWKAKPKPKTVVQALNESLFEALAKPGSPEQKKAIDELNSFTRFKVREDGFFRKILPPVPISNEELDKATPPATGEEGGPGELVTPGVTVVEKDTAALTIPFAKLPPNKVIWGPEYEVPLYPLDVEEEEVHDEIDAADNLGGLLHHQPHPRRRRVGSLRKAAAAV